MLFSSSRNISIGDWYYIDFECISNKTEPVNVTSIRPTSPRVETRVRHNICAQFRGGGFAIVKCWHCSDQFCAGSQFYSDPDKIWWPDLCVKCFPKEGTTNTSPLNEVIKITTKRPSLPHPSNDNFSMSDTNLKNCSPKSSLYLYGDMGNTHFHPYSHFSSSSSHKSNCGSSTISSFSTTHSKNTNINFNKSNESIVKNRRFSIREQERREKLEQREKLDKLAKLLESREKASYEEFKSLRSTKPPKCGSSRSSIFSSGYRQSQQEKQLNKNINNQTSSRTTYTGNTTTYGQFIHQQNIPQEKQQNIHQNIYLDNQHKQQNIDKNIEENVCQNVRQNIQQNITNNEQEYFHQNIKQNKQQNINKNKEENVFKNKQQNKQPKPVNKCFSVQKKLNVENIENSTTTSSSTLKINNVVDEQQNNNNDVYSSNNSLLNETLEIRTSESSDDNNEQHKQQQPFFGDNFNHQKAEIEILDENLIAEEFSSLKVSDTQTTKQQVVDEGEPGGFGYSRRRRFAFELKTNLEQQQKIKEGNPFQKFQFSSNKNVGKENLQKIRGNKIEGENNEDDYVIDEALNAALSDEERNEGGEEDKYNDEEVFEYDEEGVEEVEEGEEEEEEYADYSSNVSG
ncbi:unnamed protein product [Meloidogyne enterolobii]|uniref:Uncharacterized protein n=1 Tax=Meloidogyne enterolobii TaxID=390850 RepID=A0ACB1ARC2_MELEN